MIVAFAFISGIYPALLMARGKPVTLLRNSSGSMVGGGSALRRLLVGIQFTLVIVLLLASVVIRQQIDYTRQRGPGYNLDNTLTLSLANPQAANMATLLDEFARVPGVLAVGSGGAGPGRQGIARNPVRSTDGDGTVTEAGMNSANVGPDYFAVMSVPTVAGREFTREVEGTEAREVALGKVLLNASAVQALGFASPRDIVDQLVDIEFGDGSTRSVRVIGVVADTQFTSLMLPPVPEFYLFSAANGFVVVKLQPGADVAAVRAGLEVAWRSIVGDALPFGAGSGELMRQSELRREEFEARLVTGSSVLALVIALLGLYGLVAATVVKRVKEIGVRKVMGADAARIVALLLWQFSKPVLVANLVAWPLGSWAVLRWLERFPFRLDLGVIVVSAFGASVFALLVAWLTMGLLAAHAASEKPVAALRYE
jgi:putative ABC transport system permease protein